MKLTFRLTWEDYTEAMQAHAIAQMTPPPGAGLHPANAVQIVGELAPPDTAYRFVRTLLGWILVIGVMGLIFLLFQDRRTAVRGAPAAGAGSGSPLAAVVLNAIPYVCILLTFGYVAYRRMRGASGSGKWPRKAYEANPRYSQELTMDIEDWGIRLAVPTIRHECDWLAFQRVVETPNVYMLYQGGEEYQIVPKRAFASPAEAAAFRAIIETRIGDRRNSAFPVEPGARG